MMVSAMNPCQCGYYGDPVRECTCSHSSVQRYKKRISGPLLDRMDIFVEVPRVEYEKLVAPKDAESSEAVRARTQRARRVQGERFSNGQGLTNADMGPVEVWDHCQMDQSAEGLLQQAMSRMSLSARGFHRILKAARTIADLADAETIAISHLAESLQYRPMGWA